MTGGLTGGTGRARPRFSAMLRHSNLILASSLAFLAAAILGVQLGHSAISEINPIHFRGAAAPPRGIEPAAVRPPDAFASAYGWEQGNAARALDCGGDCTARRARQAVIVGLEVSAPRPASAPYWRDSTPTTEPRPWPPGETGEGTPGVKRYMHYPIEEEAAEPEAAVPPIEDEFGKEE